MRSMAMQEDAIMSIAGALTAATARYADDDISAAEFVQELTGYMTDEWSSGRTTPRRGSH
jgi:hypothetical protein